MIPIKNNLQRANAARIIFYLLVAMSIISLYSHYLQYNLLNGVKNGIPVSMEVANTNDSRQQIIAIINVLLLITSIVLFLMWMYRSYDNLFKLKNGEMSETPGWAVGYWFVPIVSLFKPYQVMKEIWEETQIAVLPETEKWNVKNGYIVGAWWTLYLMSNISSYAVTFMFRDNSSIDGLMLLTSALMFSNLFMLLNKVVTLVMINKIALHEKKLWEFVNERATHTEGQPSEAAPNHDSMNPPAV